MASSTDEISGAVLGHIDRIRAEREEYLRDQFAMAAPLQIADPGDGNSALSWPARLRINAEARYEWADAMLEARRRKT